MSKTAAQLDAEIAEALRAQEWNARTAREHAALMARRREAEQPPTRSAYEAYNDKLAAGVFHGDDRRGIDRTLTALKKTQRKLGHGAITEALAVELPRFEFLAHWLAVVTRKKVNRGPVGLLVRRHGDRWRVVSPVGGGTVVYETPDAAKLYDYVRRGELGPHLRDAEEFRALAHQRRTR